MFVMNCLCVQNLNGDFNGDFKQEKKSTFIRIAQKSYMLDLMSLYSKIRPRIISVHSLR